jgi:adenylate kinase family enzyme
VQRICVVGNSGSGKSTLAKALAARLGASYLELDSVFHQPGWQPLDREIFRDRIEAFTEAPSWVVDGNYSAVRDIVWRRADTVVWLDLPRHRVMRQLLWRTVRRMTTGAELWNGNRERWRNLLTWDRQESVISWGWHTFGSNRARYAAAAADPANEHLSFVRLTSARAVRRFLRGASGGD